MVDKFIRCATCDDILTYGLAEDAGIRALDIKQWSDSGKLGIEFCLTGKVNGNVKLEVPGLFNAYNVMAAISVCSVLGFSWEDICSKLNLVRIPGRVELVNVSDEYSVIIDYAHNEVSTRSVMETLKAYNPAHIICVYGGGGNRSKLRRFRSC